MYGNAAVGVRLGARLDAASGKMAEGATSEVWQMIVENQDKSRAWFGPKRIGYGFRPQTWQGWLVTLAVVVLVAVVAGLFAR